MTGTMARLAALGPFFAAASHDRGGEAASPWQPMRDLLDDPGITASRVHDVREYLARAGRTTTSSVELRVAASVMHLGLAARTLSPLFALSVLGCPSPPLGLRDLRWQPVTGSMFELSVAGLDRLDLAAPGYPAHEPNQGAQSAQSSGIGPVAAELCEIMRPFGVSPVVLRGNLASALNGARIALSGADPRLAPPARAELARLLATQPLLAETADTTADGRFRRRSCCLIYRAAPDRRGPVCGDCVLTPRH